MIRRPALLIDGRSAEQVAADLLQRRPGFVPEWIPPRRGPGYAVTRISARYVETVLARLNQSPDKNKLAFLEMMGIEVIPARAARAPLVFQLADGAPAVHLPAAAQMAAPPPPEETGQIVFETEQGVGLSGARIVRVASLWPGRDQYIDHTENFLAGAGISPFRREDLVDTPHILYIAHGTLLALAGKSRVDVEFELSQPGNEHLSMIWEYWDGEVWRGFKAQHPECAELDENARDSTAGFTQSGKVRLETDCAETKAESVNGQESFWIRAVLDEPLPPDPKRISPEIDAIKLSTVVEQPLSVIIHDLEIAKQQGSFVNVRLVDDRARPISIDGFAGASSGIATVSLVTEAGIALNPTPVPTPTDDLSIVHAVTFDPSGSVTGDEVLQLELTVFDDPLVRPIAYAQEGLDVTITISIGGLRPDQAFADAEELDLSGTFYPFGQQPQTGSAFYFVSEEAFSKPGARVTMVLRGAQTPQDQFTVSGSSQNNDPQLVLEHWDGRDWRLLQSVNATQREIDEYLLIDFIVPEDIALVEVNKLEKLWMRIRLASGAFGGIHQVSWTDESGPNTFTYFIPKPPAVQDFRINYVWENGPFHPEKVWAYNNFSYTDRTAGSTWPGDSYHPFELITDLTPTLYLGFDNAPPVDRFNLYFGVEEDPDADAPPALAWEYSDGFRWRELVVSDETRNLRFPGLLSFIGPRDNVQRDRFGAELYWLRGRLKEDQPPPEPELSSLYTNAVWASQLQTLRDENLGTSRGVGGEVFAFRHVPVLDGERVEVRERTGARAQVEWRLVATEVLGGSERLIQELDDLLGREGSETDIEHGDLRLRRDRNKRVIEVWVRWHPQRSLLRSGPQDRHYVVERASGRLFFGDGEHGMLLPIAAEIVAREYRSGGGRAGNVATGLISQMLAGVAGVDSVSNPIPAEGGADAETIDQLAQRGPSTLRHRGRGLLSEDFEVMAVEASPAVAFAKTIPTFDWQGRQRPGWVTLVIIPRGDEARPWPSFGLREKVRQYIEARASADIAAANRLHVTGPRYRPVDVEATLVPRDPAAAGIVGNDVRAAIELFLHPLLGGPSGSGWTPGRNVYLSDLSVVIERVDGVDYVRGLAIIADGRRADEELEIAHGQIAVAGEIRVGLEG